MATQIQSRGYNLNKKYVRCAMCKSRATQNHYVESAGGILCVCDRCNFILELKDRIAELEAELAQYRTEGN
jgi:ribosome-binding protein aMBF1 (putative translation factor)